MVASPVKVYGRDVAWIRLPKKSVSDESCPKLSNVRRNLFGFGDSEEKTSTHKNKDLDQHLEEKFRERALKSSQVWNFDFLKGVPLPGRYVWERVSCFDAPTLYSSLNRPALLKDSTNEKHRDGDSSQSQASCPGQVKSKPVKQASKKSQLVQTSMKDFTRVQKRRSSCRLKLKHLQPYSFRLRNHHPLSFKTHC